MADKTNIPKDKNCQRCEAVCCKNLAMSIGKPANRAEVEDLKWQLHFDTVKVYIRNRRWHQWVEGRCMYLTQANRCSIYDSRSQRCRRHNPPDCEFFGEFYDVLISTPDELEDYLTQKGSSR